MVVGGCSEDSRQSQDYAGIPEIDAIFAEFDKPGSPGCGLAVARDGNIIYSRGYGYANLDYDVRITPDTVFDVASINKQFVGAAISMLVLFFVVGCGARDGQV